jgi:predicted nuclease with RNAse H fold
MKIWGVDYGSKLAGTTAIAFWDGEAIQLLQSSVKKDADEFLKRNFEIHQPELIGMDAPLSLPGKYRNLPGFEDYMYRKCDREVSAMSPMFLGGLTARAMRLAEFFEGRNSQVLEVYPGGLAEELFGHELGYKKKGFLEQWIPMVKEEFNAVEMETPKNWHQFDALLALRSAMRYTLNQHREFGVASEGFIYV